MPPPQVIRLAALGDAHAGTGTGAPGGGVPVRNVAEPVLRAPYAVLTLDPSTGAVLSDATPSAAVRVR